jgi:hypothetical protein
LRCALLECGRDSWNTSQRSLRKNNNQDFPLEPSRSQPTALSLAVFSATSALYQELPAFSGDLSTPPHNQTVSSRRDSRVLNPPAYGSDSELSARRTNTLYCEQTSCHLRRLKLETAGFFLVRFGWATEGASSIILRSASKPCRHTCSWIVFRSVFHRTTSPEPALLGGPYRAIDGDPRHHLGVNEMPALAAHFPIPSSGCS